jgi:hypothetical protein
MDLRAPKWGGFLRRTKGKSPFTDIDDFPHLDRADPHIHESAAVCLKSFALSRSVRLFQGIPFQSPQRHISKFLKK